MSINNPAFILVSLLVVLGACGDLKNASSDERETRSRSGECGSTVVKDYNSLVSYCADIDPRSTQADLYECTSREENFRKKYPFVNCKATQGYGIEKRDVQVTESRIREIRRRAESIYQVAHNDRSRGYRTSIEAQKLSRIAVME